MELDIDFTDRITDFGTLPDQINVLFSGQAANYQISTHQGNFTQLVADLADAWKSKQPVRVVVRGTEIIAIDISK